MNAGWLKILKNEKMQLPAAPETSSLTKTTKTDATENKAMASVA